MTRGWALGVVPLLVSMAVVYVLTGYEFVNMMMTQVPEERSTIEDQTPQWTTPEAQERKNMS